MNDDERYEMVCKPTLGRIEATLVDMHRRLFIGNGSPSLVSQVQGIDARVKAVEAVAHSPQQRGHRIAFDVGKITVGSGVVVALVEIVRAFVKGG